MGKTELALTKMTYKDVMGKDSTEESPNIDASVFLYGNCHMFALALHDVFGYPIFKWEGHPGCHYFCIVDNKYMDVRGRLPVIVTAIEQHLILPSETQEVEEYGPENEDEEEGYEFALRIIEQNYDDYCPEADKGARQHRGYCKKREACRFD